MGIFAVVAIFAVLTTGYYLISIRILMSEYKHCSFDFWEKIGRPDSHSANHVMQLLSVIYKTEAYRECKSEKCRDVLASVRISLPVAMFFNVTLMVMVYYANKQ